jgi:Sulfotransferase family
MTAFPERSATAVASDARMPGFFIVGHAKCGTTALYEMLRAHSQIYMPEYKWAAGKEPWYFSRDNPHPQTSSERSIEYTGRRKMTLEEYLSLFDGVHPDQLIGEASTSYLWSPTAAARIAAARPDARIVAILREPASFLRSLHLQLLVNHHESEKDFRTAVALDEPRRNGERIPSHSYWPRALIYSDRVRYVEQLLRYHTVFPPEQVLVLIYDDFRADNEATLRRVLRFLDVDDAALPAAREANPSIAVRSMRLDALRRSLRRGRGPLPRVLQATGKALTSKRFRNAVFDPLERRLVYGSPPAPDEEFMTLLRRRFKPEVEAISEYLQRDLVALWGYDRIG